MTVFCWRESKLERADRLRLSGIDAIACLNCGYNLTGLNEARCPECGSRFTLDQIVASLSRRDSEMKT
jgi:predicted Zn-ribbon and HTH transcriptional regulator